MFRRKRAAAGEEEEEAAPIPTDLYAEILYRLPSHDLLHFKLVCKEWRLLIASPTFIQKHLERSNAECSDDSRIVLSSTSETNIIDCKNDVIATKKIPLGPLRILGLCDGLALYCKYLTDDMIALNPCTKKLELRTPNPSLRHDLKIDEYLLFTWFGRHPRTGEYVLIVARLLDMGTKNCVALNVYSLPRDTLLSSSISEEMEMGIDGPIGEAYSLERVGTLLNGRLHYPLGGSLDILVYDLETEEIEITSCLPTSYVLALGVLDGCLCALRWYEVWVMKEYGVKESWTRYNIDFDVEGILKVLPKIADPFPVPIAVCPDGDLILIDDLTRMLAKYNLRDRKTKPLVAHKNFIISVTVTSGIDSLVSPASVWGN